MPHPFLPPILAGITGSVIALAVGLGVRHVLRRRQQRDARARQAVQRRRVAIRRPDPPAVVDDAWVAEVNAVLAAAWRGERA